MANEEKCCSSRKALIRECLESMPPDTDIKCCAEFFKAISDPARVKIVCALADSELCVCDLMEIMGMQQTAVSHHLKILKNAKIITDRKAGKWVNYSLTDPRAIKALKAIKKKP